MAIEYELVDRVAHLRMDDGTANVLNRGSCDELRRGIAGAADDHAGALVLSGRAGIFSGGIDLAVLRDRDADRRRITLIHISHTLLALWTAPIPTVAAVTGHAIAGGAILAMACDVRIGVAGAFKIGTNETSLRMVLPRWASTIIGDAIRPECANEVMVLGRLYDPDGAERVGIVHETAPVDGLDIVVDTVASELAALPTTTYAANKLHLRGDRAQAAAGLVRREMDLRVVGNAAI